MESGLRHRFEGRFGRSLADVRVHIGDAAAERAGSLSAHAFTYGSHLVFARGRYAPEHAEGQSLIAHELAHAVQQQGRAPVVQRAPDEHAEDARRFVEATIKQFNVGAEAAANPEIPFDEGRFDRSLTSWLTMVVRQETMIDDSLGGDATLRDSLRAAYVAALRAAVTRWASVSGTSEAELYRINSGRIPLWAWPEPHVRVPGISTPLPEALAGGKATGPVTFTLNGVEVTVHPDATDPKLKDKAKTTFQMLGPAPYAHTTEYPESGRVVFRRFDPTPPPTFMIQTLYRPGVGPSDLSAYGRGRTTEDVAGSSELSESRTLGFHEGTHGLALLEYIANHPPPKFEGKGVKTMEGVQKAKQAYWDAITAYQDAAGEYSLKVGDCVGEITIDVHNVEEARKADAADAAAAAAKGLPPPPPRIVTLVCKP